MKVIRYIFSIVMLISVAFASSCKGEEDPTTTIDALQERIDLLKNGGEVWSLVSVINNA